MSQNQGNNLGFLVFRANDQNNDQNNDNLRNRQNIINPYFLNRRLNDNAVPQVGPIDVNAPISEVPILLLQRQNAGNYGVPPSP